MNRALVTLIAFSTVGIQSQASFDTPAQVAFGKLKSLAGDWKGEAGEQLEGLAGKVSYKVIADGSAVVETIFGGTKNEMVTVYHLDKTKLLLTNYCFTGNQARLKMVNIKEDNVLRFDFVSGTNMSSKDAHMHGLTIQFVDQDYIKVKWQTYENGKPAMYAFFDLHRMKPESK